MTDKIREILDELDTLSTITVLDNPQHERKLVLEDITRSFLENEAKGTERSNFVKYVFRGEPYSYKKVLLTTYEEDEFAPYRMIHSELSDYINEETRDDSVMMYLGDQNDIPRMSLYKFDTLSCQNTLMELTEQANYHECDDNGYTHVIIKLCHHHASTKDVEEAYQELQGKYPNAEITIVGEKWRGYRETKMDTSIVFPEYYTNFKIVEEFGEILKFAKIL